MQELEDPAANSDRNRPMARHREVVDFGQVIGEIQTIKDGSFVPTTRGTIHYSKSGCHVVPAEPKE